MAPFRSFSGTGARIHDEMPVNKQQISDNKLRAVEHLVGSRLLPVGPRVFTIPLLNSVASNLEIPNRRDVQLH